jgi:hypothetical protein
MRFMAMSADISPESLAQHLRIFGGNHSEIQAVLVFGSVASGATHKGSDLDIAVLLQNDPDPTDSVELRLTYSLEIEDLVNLPADVVVLNCASPMLRYQIFRKGKIVYTADERRTRRFMGDALVEFYDEIEMIERMQDRTIRRLIGR